MRNWAGELATLLKIQNLLSFAAAVAILIVGLFIARRARQALARSSHFDMQQRLVFGNAAYYGLVTLSIAAALSQLGFDLKVILGAAGVLTVAIGFAAQTSASNLISGLFLMVDRPFVIGNIISVGDIRGEVLSIDLLSSKIRTFNNLMVRIPNETMVKSNITNYSFFPIRRLDFNLGVAYASDLPTVEATLRKVASSHPLCLDEPSAVFLFNGFGEFSMNIQFQVWTLTENLVTLQNEIYREIKLAFDREGIEIPYPTRHLITTAQKI
jgi:small-conductance mechanosensitive channel